jgi:hypothetical protein
MHPTVHALASVAAQTLVYNVTLRWFAAAVLLLVSSFVTNVVASLVY